MTGTSQTAVIVTGPYGNVGSAVVGALAPTRPLGLLTHGAARALDLWEGARVHVVEQLDHSDPEALARAVRSVRAALGPIGALVHTIGGYAGGAPLLTQTLQTERNMVEVNYFSALAVMRAVLPALEPGGRIVLFASADALHASPGASAYAASKAALVRAAEALAREVAPQGIGICVLAPTTIDTETNRSAMPDADRSGWVSLTELSELVAYLVSPASRAIRFAVLPLGG